MDVFTMTVEVLLIPNLMLPKSPLPNNEFPVLDARGREFNIGGRSPPYYILSRPSSASIQRRVGMAHLSPD
jgi:hypothetical protein